MHPPTIAPGKRVAPARLIQTLGLVLLTTQIPQAGPLPEPGPAPQAAAPALLVQSVTADKDRPPIFHPYGWTLYSIGQPTDEEQLYLEYINRSRANPPAEGVRLANTTDPDVLGAYQFYNVNLAQMQFEFSTNPPVPPLAMNPKLLTAARIHTTDMLVNEFQGNPGSDGSSPQSRVTAQGYPFAALGENVYSYAKSVFHGHAALNVDWGMFPGGMKNPRGGRNLIHSAAFREIGIGVVLGTNGTVGPQLVTQDFGTQLGSGPFITGVVYYDFNGNGFYDLGEGIGGVSVDVPDSQYYAITASSGGYTIPVTSNGNYAVTFSAPGLANNQVANISGAANAKVDYVPLYSPPTISGPNLVSVGEPNLYTFSSVGAALSYQWEQLELVPYNNVEGGENGLTNLTAITSGYAVIVNDLTANGSAALHLCHPEPLVDQFLTLKTAVRAAPESELSFYKRLGWATTNQVARAQISTNGGADWVDVWSQKGNDSESDTSFAVVNVSLSPFAGQVVKARFVYDHLAGSFYPQDISQVGLLLDDIAFINVSQTANQVTNNIPSGNSFVFSPTSLGSYLLRVRALLSGRTLPWGPALPLTVGPSGPKISILGPPVLSGNQVQLEFNVVEHRSGMTFELWKASEWTAGWSYDPTATLEVLVPDSRFRLSTTASGSQEFFRVKGNF